MMQRRLIIFVILLCVVGAGIWSVVYRHRIAKADSISTLLSGSVYGLAVVAGDGTTHFSAGPFGQLSTVCTPYPGNQKLTHGKLNLFHGLLTSGTIQDSLTFKRDDEYSSVEASTTVEHLTIGNSLLPLLELDGLHAVARSSAHIGRAGSDTSASFLGTMRVAGLSLPLSVAPNTRLNVPGLGTVVLNEQTIINTNLVTTSAEVNMLDITLGVHNLLNAPAGMRILVGHSVSSDVIVSVLAAIQSHAAGLSTFLGLGALASLHSGPLPATEIGCTGGTNEASAVSLRVRGLVDAGVASTRTMGVLDEANSTVAVLSTEKIAHLSMLGGFIQAGLLQDYARAVYRGNQRQSDCGLEVLGLSIGGLKLLPRTYAPNTRLTLPGLGYIIVHEVLPEADNISSAMNALDIHITAANRWHLALGLRIVVGHVDAGIHIFR